MRKCNKWVTQSVLSAAAIATIGFTQTALATTFYLYDANALPAAPDPTSTDGGSWTNDIGGTQTLITAGAGAGADGNYWMISDSVTNGSKGYLVVPPQADYTDPSGWTATIVCKVLASSANKTVPIGASPDSTGTYPAPSFLDIRTGSYPLGTPNYSALATMGQVNAGADESFFRAKGGSTNDTPLQDMDVHSYFNTYQMVYTPPQYDGDGVLLVSATLTEYVNGHQMADATPVGTTGVNRIQWFSGSQASTQLIQYQKIQFETGADPLVAPTPETWSPNGGGELTLNTNWLSGNVPGGVNSTAQLGQTDAPATVTVSSPISLGLLQLTNTSGYTISGTGTLNLVNSIRGAGAIDVVSGNQVISAPISPERSGMFTVLDPTASLSLTGIVDTVGKDFRKDGPGSMDVANVRANSLKVSAGTLTIRPNGTAAGVSKVTSLDIAFNNSTLQITSTTTAPGEFKPLGTLQLNNNPLIIDYTGTSPTTTLRNSLKGAFDGGAWDGPGLTSSNVQAVAADSSNLFKTALGYAEASAIGVTMVGDQTLDSSSLLVRITLSGDSNLDGKVNALDFNALASTFGTATNKTWGQGDFNYDGTVNTSDFMMLATNFGQAMTLSPAPALGSVVPEPVGFSVIALSVVAWSLKRSRRARNSRAVFQLQSCT